MEKTIFRNGQPMSMNNSGRETISLVIQPVASRTH
jgi:hypothetical protein